MTPRLVERYKVNIKRLQKTYGKASTIDEFDAFTNETGAAVDEHRHRAHPPAHGNIKQCNYVCKKCEYIINILSYDCTEAQVKVYSAILEFTKLLVDTLV